MGKTTEPAPGNASSNEAEIVIPKWGSFQHYKKQTRPPWIKSYTKLLHDDSYLSLTDTQRAVLHGLWLLYAASGRKVPGNTSKLSRQLSMRVTKRTLEALEQAGFIRFRSRAGLDELSSRREEEEKKLKAFPDLATNGNGLSQFQVPKTAESR